MRPTAASTGALALVLIATSLSSPAPAADEEPTLPPELSQLAACKAIAEPQARLACFDTAANALLASAESGDVRIVNKDEARKVRRSLFGFSLPSIGLFGGGKDDGEDEAVELLETTVTGASRLSDGKVVFTIAEGDATWQTTETNMALRVPSAGDTVELKRAALGSYWVKFQRQRPVKGKRVN